MSAYNNNAQLKADVVRMARKHEAEDRYIRGGYYRNGTTAWKGCSQGCTVKSLQLLGVIGDMDFGDHFALAQALGLPVFLTRMADRVFESLPVGEHISWTGDLYEAIQVGKDLSSMQHDFLAWLLNHPRWGVAQYTDDSRVLRVAEMYASGETYTREQWLDAKTDAYAAAAAAAAAAEYAYAAAAAAEYAYAAAYAAADAYAAAYAAADAAAAAYAAAAAAAAEYAAAAAAAAEYAVAAAAARGRYWRAVHDWILAYVAAPELVATTGA